MTQRLASCSCGQLTVETTGEPLRVSICHCHACQRRTGSVFGVQARFAAENVTPRGRSSRYMRVGESGGKARFYFCPACGATVHYQLDGLDHLVGIPVGAFADASFPRPNVSVFEDCMHGWVVLPEDIEHER
ncbi:GFA family protein [Dyella soli]|uniref:GFA family protein n=1 Tax=Dyella soli TaxID=522319 RepID=A0A4V2NM15_9GAMM|nr:GFA family protein [Dyella soli]TCI11281.1 GFA family protein [Dyella soli]